MQQEIERLRAHYAGTQPWLRWGPYLSERQWGTVREDYSPDGNAWQYFPHDHARSRTYRWGEDGLAGISDDQQRLCFGLALWNGKDPILKERLFGLTGPEGNHGEDVKELYYYLDNTPSHGYMEYLYKYPLQAFPYEDLVETNRQLDKTLPEYELIDTGVFGENHYVDVHITYAKAQAEDILIRIALTNRSRQPTLVHVLPKLWFRNEWVVDPHMDKPFIDERMEMEGFERVRAWHPQLGTYYFYGPAASHGLFTENETNKWKIFGVGEPQPFVKDAFHEAVITGRHEPWESRGKGTQFAWVYPIALEPGERESIDLRLGPEAWESTPFGEGFDALLGQARASADAFYASIHGEDVSPDLARIQRQAFAGMLWTKQYYHIDIPTWLHGDPGQPTPPEERKKGRNHQWLHLNNADILSMPDKWEYPWYAAWDLAFHCIPLTYLDPDFAKNQLILILREWYMAPNGQIPAYEWNFSDVNPPVEAFAALKVYALEKERTGTGDLSFLKRVFQKLMINFTWWVNRKDLEGNNVFEGGFLGLDNIGIFDRSHGLPGGGVLEQADGTSWMALYCLNMMNMALEIAKSDKSFEDVATKFLEHFVYIAESINQIGEDGVGLWDDSDGFYYDLLHLPNGRYERVKIRSLVGLSPLFAVSVISADTLEQVPGFVERLNWFRNYRRKMGKRAIVEEKENGDILLAMVSRERLERMLRAMLDEEEFLAPGGIRSISKYHLYHEYTLEINGAEHSIRYEPGESTTYMFGGNSNWRGPVWMPMNYMLIEALETYCGFYDQGCVGEFPSGSGTWMSLSQIAEQIARRLIGMFAANAEGYRPIHGQEEKYAKDPHFRELILFYEYFHGDTSRGLGASHQTGWTGLVADLIQRFSKDDPHLQQPNLE